MPVRASCLSVHTDKAWNCDAEEGSDAAALAHRAVSDDDHNEHGLRQFVGLIGIRSIHAHVSVLVVKHVTVNVPASVAHQYNIHNQHQPDALSSFFHYVHKLVHALDCVQDVKKERPKQPRLEVTAVCFALVND